MVWTGEETGMSLEGNRMAEHHQNAEGVLTDADERLWRLIESQGAKAEEVRAAIAGGANVNSMDSYGSSVLATALFSPAKGSLEIVKLLLEHGADVNHQDEDGFSPLAEAFYRHDPAVIECLLKYGANPNLIVDRFDCSTVLDIAVTDLDYHEMENINGPGNESDKRACELVSAIVDLLKSAGAKSIEEMVATEPREWLWMFDGYRTGLLTRDGYLHVANVPNVSDALRGRFNDWLLHDCDRWSDTSLENHAQEGRNLAREIKQLVGTGVILDYGWTRIEDAAKGIWKIEWDRNVSGDQG